MAPQKLLPILSWLPLHPFSLQTPAAICLMHKSLSPGIASSLGAETRSLWSSLSGFCFPESTYCTAMPASTSHSLPPDSQATVFWCELPPPRPQTLMYQNTTLFSITELNSFLELPLFLLLKTSPPTPGGTSSLGGKIGWRAGRVTEMSERSARVLGLHRSSLASSDVVIPLTEMWLLISLPIDIL